MPFPPRLALVAVLLVFGTPRLHAQYPETRQGFWIGTGLGYGSFGRSCNGCFFPREDGVSGFLKLGFTITPGWLLGVETNGWTKTLGVESSGWKGATESSTILARYTLFVAYLFPDPKLGLFVRLGFGMSSYRQSTSSAARSGFAFALGVGYDIHVGSNMSVTPVANFNQGDMGELSYLSGSARQNVVQLGLGITFH